MPERVVIVAFDGVQSLDVTGPAEVFAHAAREPEGRRYQVVVASWRGGTVAASSGLTLGTTRLDDVRCGARDTILVAGGNHPGISAACTHEELLRCLRARAGRVRRVASVCSGAFVLAAAGLLDGRRVATHWSAASRLAAFRPQVTVDGNAIFVRDGNIWTSAGITTGIDMALAMVEEDCDRAVADRIAAQLVLHARRPGFQAQFSDLLRAQAQQDNPLADALAWARDHLTDLDVERLARRAAVSVRTLHRLCTTSLRTTPAKLIERVRTDRARVILATTDLAAKQVAAQCGFRDAAQLARSFRRSFGVSPHAYRMLRGEAGRSGAPRRWPGGGVRSKGD